MLPKSHKGIKQHGVRPGQDGAAYRSLRRNLRTGSASMILTAGAAIAIQNSTEPTVSGGSSASPQSEENVGEFRIEKFSDYDPQFEPLIKRLSTTMKKLPYFKGIPNMDTKGNIDIYRDYLYSWAKNTPAGQKIDDIKNWKVNNRYAGCDARLLLPNIFYDDVRILCEVLEPQYENPKKMIVTKSELKRVENFDSLRVHDHVIVVDGDIEDLNFTCQPMEGKEKSVGVMRRMGPLNWTVKLASRRHKLTKKLGRALTVEPQGGMFDTSTKRKVVRLTLHNPRKMKNTVRSPTQLPTSYWNLFKLRKVRPGPSANGPAVKTPTDSEPTAPISDESNNQPALILETPENGIEKPDDTYVGQEGKTVGPDNNQYGTEVSPPVTDNSSKDKRD